MQSMNETLRLANLPRTYENAIQQVKQAGLVWRGDYRLIVESPDGEIHHYGIHGMYWTFPGYAEMLTAKRRQGVRNPKINRYKRMALDAQYTRERVFELFREKCRDNTRVALIYHSYSVGIFVAAEKAVSESPVALLPAGDAGMFPAAHPRSCAEDEVRAAGGGNPDADLDGAEYSAHLDTCALTHAIQDQAYLRHFAAAHLAAKAVEGGYTGGAVIGGVGEFGLDTALWTVIYPVGDVWHLYAGYRLDDGRWITVQCAQNRDVRVLRWVMSWQHQARLHDVNPASVEAEV